MVLEGKGRLYRRNNRVYIYVPSEISIDSAFPFHFEKGDVKIRIDINNKRIIIENIKS
jgi:hypothetical protein